MNKKLLGVLGVAALLLAGNFAWQEVKEVDAEEKGSIMCLVPSEQWKEADAWTDAWVWGENVSGEWVTFGDSNNDGIYTAQLPVGVEQMILLRKAPGSSHDWNCWNRLDNVGIPEGDKICFYPNESRDGGSWGQLDIDMVGSLYGWSSGSCRLTDENHDGIFEKEIMANTGEHEFKILRRGTWLGNKGTVDNVCSGWTMDGDSNCVWNAQGGKYKIQYALESNKVSIVHVSTADEMVIDLFDSYYNNGSYTKISELNVKEIAANEVAKYFHAKANIKYRKTVYTPEGLSMTTSADGETYSENASVYTTVGANVQHTGAGGTYTVTGKTVESWFVTLHDFKESTLTGWTFENGVYTYNLTPTTATEEHEMTRMAREFVAPMWLAPNEKNYNYVIFTKLTVEVSGEDLVMKLYVDPSNYSVKEGEGTITDENGIFSQVTISK